GGSAHGDRTEERGPAGDDLDLGLGADECDRRLLGPAVEDDRGAVASDLRAGGAVDRGSRVRQRWVVQRLPGEGDPGRGRLGDEQQQTGRGGGGEHLVGDNERNITIIVEERGTDLVRGQGR